MSQTPHPLTLLEWADRLAAGESCAQWELWLESSPNAQDEWRWILAAHNRLSAGEATHGESSIAEHQVAAFIDGRLDETAIAEIEAACLHSPALVDEIASAAQFGAHSDDAPASAALEARLLALVPTPPFRNGHKAKLPVAKPLPPEPANNAAPSPRYNRVPIVRAAATVSRSRFPTPPTAWQIAAAAGLLAVSLCAVALWLAATSGRPRPKSPVIVKNAPPAEMDDPPQPRLVPDLPRRNETAPPPAPQDPPTVPSSDQSPVRPNDSPALPDAPVTPPIRPRSIPAPLPRLGPPPSLAFSSSRGAMLVDSGPGATWQVVQGKLPPRDSLHVVSLPESWTAVEIPSVGTSVWSGAAAATLSIENDALTVRLEHGKFGLQNLPAGAAVRFETPGGQWTARGVQDYSTLAIVADELSPKVFVPRGAVSIDDVLVGQDQLVRWQNGAPLPPEPLPAVAGAAAVDDPLDPRWLTPPTPEEQKAWQETYGKLVERLAASDDINTELDRLLTPTTHARQAALLAQWRIELIEDDGEQASATWSLLSDRRELVRVAAFRYLLALEPHDPRARNVSRLARRELGTDLATRLANWLSVARQGQTPTAAEARDLCDGLGSSELVIRQVAVSLLLKHTASGFERTRRTPPDYDAAGPATRRTAAQRQWEQAVRQIFGRGQLNAPAALRPAAP